MCLKIYRHDPLYFLSARGLAWQACLKKRGVILELLTDYDMLLQIEKGIRGGICQAKQNDSSFIEYLDANNLYGWGMFQNVPVTGFEWVKNLSNLAKTS